MTTATVPTGDTVPPDSRPCDKYDWCQDHEPKSGRHACAFEVGQLDDGSPKYLQINLWEQTPDFDEPTHLVFTIDVPNDWYMRTDKFEAEIADEIQTLERGRTLIREWLAAHPDLEAAQR